MALKSYKPTTPSQRNLVIVDRTGLYRGKPVKSLVEGQNSTVGRDGEYVILRLNSAEQRLVHGRCLATVGAVSNPDNMNTTIGKAGRQRWKGRMPHNRGITMNPVDHPHGGRTKGGGHPVTPWGFPTKGKKTRKNKATGKFIMISRHARKKTS